MFRVYLTVHGYLVCLGSWVTFRHIDKRDPNLGWPMHKTYYSNSGPNPWTIRTRINLSSYRCKLRISFINNLLLIWEEQALPAEKVPPLRETHIASFAHLDSIKWIQWNTHFCCRAKTDILSIVCNLNWNEVNYFEEKKIKNY